MSMQLADFGAIGMSASSPEPEQPRVLICIPTLGGGGAERQVRLLARPLVDRGIALSLFSRLTDGDAETLSEAGVQCFRTTAAGNHNPLLALELIRAIRGANADILHTFMPQMDILGGAVALALRKVWLLSERSSRPCYLPTAKNRLRAWLGHRSDGIVTNSTSGLDVWPSHPSRRIIPNGIDLQAIQNAPADLLDGREVLRGRTVVVSVARLSEEKRLERLLGAATRLKREVPNLLVVLVGTGPEERALRALSAELGIDDQILFTGFRTDVWSWLKHAAAFVSTSRYEGQPNAVLEAAVAGIPQILSDIPSHRAAVGNGGALFVSSDDVQVLADAILSQLRDQDSARQMAGLARRRVEVLSVDRSAGLLADTYREVLSARSTRRSSRSYARAAGS
jgi:glycosyltransferase involved in cell wall biosynthesis